MIEPRASVTRDTKQDYSAVSGLSVTDCRLASSLNTVFNTKVVYGDASNFLEELQSSGLGSKAPLLSGAAYPTMPESTYWDFSGMSQLATPQGQELWDDQLSSGPLPCNALPDVEALAFDGSSSALGHLPRRVGDPGMYQMLDKPQNQQEDMLLPPQSMPSHWRPMQCFMYSA